MGCFRYVYILLAVVTVAVGMQMIDQKDRSFQLQRLPRMLEATREQMKGFAGYLREYEKAHGRYPTNDEGLLAVKPLVQACNSSVYDYDAPIYRCRVRESGILTRFGDPFVYENRRGIDPRKFADSAATRDGNRRYSVRVDKDVYVWSVGARQACETLALWRPRLKAASYAVGLIVLGFLALFMRESVIIARRESGAAKRWGSGIASALGGLLGALFAASILFPVFARSCYEQSINWSRKPKLTAEYKTLLAKYHKRGVINEATYKKITAAMDKRDDRPF